MHCFVVAFVPFFVLVFFTLELASAQVGRVLVGLQVHPQSPWKTCIWQVHFKASTQMNRVLHLQAMQWGIMSVLLSPTAASLTHTRDSTEATTIRPHSCTSYLLSKTVPVAAAALPCLLAESVRRVEFDLP